MKAAIEQLITKVGDCGFRPRGFLEIGSRDGRDAIKVAKEHGINPSRCLIVEAHPQLYRLMKNDCNLDEFNILNCAASESDGEIIFNAADLEKEPNPGRSSVLDRMSPTFVAKKVMVPALTMRSALALYPNCPPDLCKIDVEGFTLPVLHGFGDSLRRVEFLQVELEVRAFWKGQALAEEVKGFLDRMGFSLIDEIAAGNNTQIDALFRRI